jgi:hypothetical protein
MIAFGSLRCLAHARRIGGALLLVAGESIYFGASGYHLRNKIAGDPDLGWVGRYKEKDAPVEPVDPRLTDRRGNIWTRQFSPDSQLCQ